MIQFIDIQHGPEQGVGKKMENAF